MAKARDLRKDKQIQCVRFSPAFNSATTFA